MLFKRTIYKTWLLNYLAKVEILSIEKTMPTVSNELVFKLNQAIRAKDVLTVISLLEAFDDKNINDYDLKDLLVKRRAIDCAIESGSPLIVQLICNKKPKLDEPPESSCQNPVHLAMTLELNSENREELEKIFKILYLAGANFRAKEKITGYSLLHLAILHGKTAFIPDLVRLCRCDINATDSHYATPMKLAIDKYGINNQIVTMIQDLGGKLHSDATMELHNRFNQSYEKYLKYAKRYPLKFHQAPQGSIVEETDEDFCRLGNNKRASLAEQSLLAQPKSQKLQEAMFKSLVDTHVKALLGGASDKLYQIYFKILERHTGKQALIKDIIAECTLKEDCVNNMNLYHLRIDALKKLIPEAVVKSNTL